MGFLSNKHNHCRCPRYFHSEKASNRIVADTPLIETALVCWFHPHRTISDIVSRPREQIRELIHPTVIGVVMADENMPSS
jgi:hypothetical protein